MPDKIQSFTGRETDQLYAISLATADLGNDGSRLYGDKMLMGHIYSCPYATLEPSLVLLWMDQEGVAGLVLGTLDTAAWEARLEREWWPALRNKYEEVDHVPAQQRTPDQRRMHMIHHPTPTPKSVVSTSPAHLHLNLLPRAQGKGIGKMLLNAWLERASKLGADAVHVGVNRHNSRAVRFWCAAGFTRLHEHERTVWLGKTIRKAPSDVVP